MQYEPEFESVVNPGDYGFKIVRATETATKLGKPCLKLTVSVFDGKGNKSTINLINLLSFSFGLRKIAKATGLVKQYEDKSLEAHDFELKEGHCSVDIEESEQYGRKNIIVSWHPKTENDIVDNDVPF